MSVPERIKWQFSTTNICFKTRWVVHSGCAPKILVTFVALLTVFLLIYDRLVFSICLLAQIVLDVGCGTGILSMFAVQAGAKHVYAVDCSKIIDQARLIVERNGFSNQITLIQGKMEDVELPVEQVDVLVSEWMGYFLLYESMLDTVLFARDKWLKKPGGILFPDKAVMYLCGLEDAVVKRDRIDFWDNVYGFDMTPIKEIALREPVVDVVDSKVCPFHLR